MSWKGVAVLRGWGAGGTGDVGPKDRDTSGSTGQGGTELGFSLGLALQHAWPGHCFSFLGPLFAHLQNALMPRNVGLKELLWVKSPGVSWASHLASGRGSLGNASLLRPLTPDLGRAPLTTLCTPVSYSSQRLLRAAGDR